MKIEKLRIHNWRSIRDLEATAQDLMVFIGQNNHGKSNILSSILFFFSPESSNDLDFCQDEKELYIEITFSNLDEHDKKQFQKYAIGDRMRVRKQSERGGETEYHGFCRIPAADWLREENALEYAKKRARVEETPLKDLVPLMGKLSQAVVLEAQQKYLSENKVEVIEEFEATKFLGLKNVAAGIFGNIYFIPAVKNASDEFKSTGSMFGPLLNDIIAEMASSNENFKKVKEAVSILAQILNKRLPDGTLNKDRPEAISKLEQMLEAELQSNFHWNSTIDIDMRPPNVDQALKLGTTVLVNDPIPTDISRKGHGLQRSLIFALIKVWAKILQEKAKEEENKPRSASKSTFFIFEEPELYLHPQAQRELYASLKELSKLNNQIFLSTHSSSFIDLNDYRSLCIIYKNDLAEGTKLRQCVSELFPASEDKKMFDMSYWVNPDRGELFLGKKVLLLEGQTEKTAIHFLAQHLGVFKYEYTLIDCGSKGNIPTYLQLLNQFRIPYVAVYDLDHQISKNKDQIVVADKATEAIKSKINPSLGRAVQFDNDIEEELGIPMDGVSKNPYSILEFISNASYKLPDSMQSKIKEIFAD